MNWFVIPLSRGCVPAQYGEFRGGFEKDKEDTRLVFYGMRYIIENFVARQWTQRDVDEAARFFKCAPHSLQFRSSWRPRSRTRVSWTLSPTEVLDAGCTYTR